jgi:hypothetical protein
MLLAVAAIAAVLAIGRWRDAPLAPILVAATTACLLAFLVRWRHWDVLLAESLAFAAGATMALCLSLPGPVDREERVVAVVLVGLISWVVAAAAIRVMFPEAAERMTGKEPECDEIEVRRLPDPDPSRPHNPIDESGE